MRPFHGFRRAVEKIQSCWDGFQLIDVATFVLSPLDERARLIKLMVRDELVLNFRDLRFVMRPDRLYGRQQAKPVRQRGSR